MSSRRRESAGHVVSTELVTPRTCRVVVASDGLRGYRPDGLVARHLKLVLPPRLLRTFTARAFDQEANAVSIELALHDGGLAATWAAGAQPGDAVGILGPAGGHRVRRDLGRYVLAGDETAVPAIATILEALGRDQQADVLVEVADETDERPLPGHANVTWLHRRGGPFGERLERAFHELEIERGETFVWAAGEAAAIRRLRRHVRDELELARSDFEIGGYWVERFDEDEGVARNRAAWRAALAAGKSEAEIEDALLY